ncbi:MAG: glutamine synthetase family protein [Actinomycetota bacterium]|nr:glutamine synthetase family protein [Actinomycetota bacterium]
MTPAELGAWLDENRITTVRTEGASLDGLVLGKHLSRDKFERSLPLGPALSDLVFAWDIGDAPQLGWWADFRQPALGDVHQRPDLSTIVVSPNRPGMANVLVDHTTIDGTPLPVCPRVVLRGVVDRLAARGFTALAAYELEFMLFRESYDDARRAHYRNLTPIGTPLPVGYTTHNAHYVAGFMDEVVRRLDGLAIPWEAWSDEAAPGQVELNFVPADPLSAADRVFRAKQVVKEVALDRGASATFMAKATGEYGNGMHIHHSLRRDGAPVFFDGRSADHRSADMRRWIGGLVATMPGAVSILAPTVNSYRRMVGFAAAPTTPTWGEENKSTALRVISRSEKLARIEHRVASADVNVYLALAVILAGGLAGIDGAIEPPPEHGGLAWGEPPGCARLPSSISRAADELEHDKLLAEVLGDAFVDYWLHGRRWEWLMFHTGGGDAEATTVTDWELDRYFELV